MQSMTIMVEPKPLLTDSGSRLEICYAKIVFKVNSYQNTVTYRSVTSPFKPSTVPSVIAVGALSRFVVVMTAIAPTLNDWKKLFHFKKSNYP